MGSSDELTPTKRLRSFNDKSDDVETAKESLDDVDGGVRKDRSQSDEQCRGSWGNQFEFLLSTLGMAVGLGNIWRFPTRAYKNGGSAFLIPYISCALLFGLPSIYLEFLLGQYHRTTAPVIFRRIAPIFQGVGWMAVAVSSCVAIYYVIIIGWSTVYMASIVNGHSSLWSRCDNDWNNVSTCIDLSRQDLCKHFNATFKPIVPMWANLSIEGRGKSFVFFNNSCYDRKDIDPIESITATEQYFFNYVVRPSDNFLDFNRINIRSFIGMNICWLLVALIICKGVEYMGKASYIIVTLPYFIIFLLFIRGITLDGASDGLYYYLGNPDWSKVFDPVTWGEALKQLCFSLGIGYGGMIGMSSYSKPDNNCYRDALIVIVGDTIMSLVGGAAVFSTLGFLAKQKGCDVADVVNSGLSLAFVAFPEAMSRMPLPWLWSFLFFIMLFFLGISTEVAYVSVFTTAICDQFVGLRRRKWMVVVCWCLFLYMIGLIMVTDGGFYWFIMFDEYAAGVSSCVAVTSEVLIVAYVYGRKNMQNDMLEMFGPSMNTVTSLVGIHSPFFMIAWMVATPILGIILIFLASAREYPHLGRPDVFPIQFDIIGWFICLLPMLMVPVFAIAAILEFNNRNLNWRGLFMKQRQIRSFPRMFSQMSMKQRKLQLILPDREPWDCQPSGFLMSKQSNSSSIENDNSKLIQHKTL